MRIRATYSPATSTSCTACATPSRAILALRSADIVALAGALGVDRDEIEARIAEVLGCTRAEARRLHGELLRRKVILPVAGLAAGMAAFAGAAYASHSPSPSPSVAVHAQSIAATQPSTTSSTVAELVPAHPAPVPTTTVAPVETTSTTVAPAPVAPVTTPSTVEQHQTETTVAPAPPAPETPVTPAKAASPQPADPPVSVLPGETPITIIGPADTP